MKYIDVRKKRGSAKDYTITKDDFDLLYNKLVKDSHKVILILGARAGLRVQEIIQTRFEWLEWIDTERFGRVICINIPKEDKDIFNKRSYWRPKTGEERTTYILDNELSNFIYMWFKFNQDGLQVTRQNVTTHIVKKKFIDIINRKITTHGLRATCQNYWKFILDMPDIFIQACLGHKDSRTTFKHYTTMNKQSTNDLLQQIEK